MNKEELEIKVVSSLIVLDTKIKALKKAIPDDQKKIYDKEIRVQKPNVEKALKKLLTEKEVDEVLESISE